MAVGTEVAQPVSILDGVCKSPAGGDPKEDGAAAGDNILSVSEVETTSVEASDPTCLGTPANMSLFCSVPENEGCVQSIPINAVIMDKVQDSCTMFCLVESFGSTVHPSTDPGCIDGGNNRNS